MREILVKIQVKIKLQFDISGVGKYDTKTMYMDITQKISYRFIDIRTWAC